MPRPIILGVVGDSAAGKTTLTRGLVRVLGEENVTHVCTDDYHRYDRRQRAERNITPLHPDCNYMDIMAQHLAHLRAGEPILKPVYRHNDGTFGPPVYVEPHALHGHRGPARLLHRRAARRLRRARLPRPPEELRRSWKVQRDCSRRGYTTDQVLAELDRREPDSEAFIRPQRAPRRHRRRRSCRGGASDHEHLDAELTLRDGLPHPDLTPFVDGGPTGITLTERDGERILRIPGDIDPEHAAADRGGDLGARCTSRATCARDRLGRVHDRHRAAPLGVARARPAADPLPPGHREGGGRARRPGTRADVHSDDGATPALATAAR